jgi:hypothetical protein
MHFACPPAGGTGFEREPSKLEALKSGEIPAMLLDPNTIVALEILDVLQTGVDTRRPAMIEISLDCLHRLVMHKMIKGQVFAISSKSSGESGAEGAKADEADVTPQAIALELYCK